MKKMDEQILPMKLSEFVMILLQKMLLKNLF